MNLNKTRSMKRMKPFPHSNRFLVALIALSASVLAGTAHAEVSVSLPNGYASLSVDDLRVQSRGGAIRWMREWDGREWKFNPHWESLSQSWRNLTGSQTADTTGSAATGSSRGTSSSCSVSVDEDYTPTKGTAVIGGVLEGTPLIPVRSTPFNRGMNSTNGDYPATVRASLDYATLCAGSSASLVDAEALRRLNSLYLGENGRLSFDNRTLIEKRSVRGPKASPSTSSAIVTTPVIEDIAKGWRWSDRAGNWIDYDAAGRVVAYGDANDNIIWLQRDDKGVLHSVHDTDGRLIYSLHYQGELLVEVRDYPDSRNSLDLPARSIQYAYDASNRLHQVTDPLGHLTQYDYDAANRLTKVTDAEGHAEQISYNGDLVKQRIAPDGGVTDYAFSYDETNKQFISKITGPETEAGRRVEDLTHNRVGQLVRQIINGVTYEEVRYDTGARTETHTNTRGFTTQRIKNEFDQIVKRVNEDGTSTLTSYSALNLKPTEETDELGIKTQYQYDAQGNLTKKTEAAGTADERSTEYENSSDGKPTKITRKGRTEANGTITQDTISQIAYDALGQIAQTTDPEGKVRSYTYDRAGNLVKVTDPLGHSTRYEVDAQGRLTKVTDALGHSRSYGYDKVGNLTRETDARGKATLAAYDAMNHRTQTTNAVGGIGKIAYNAEGLPIRIEDEDGRATQLGFDNFQQLAQQADALNNQTRYGYQITDGSTSGAVGSLYSATEVKYPTFTQQNRFDARERATLQSLTKASADGTKTSSSETSRSYDKAGRLISETDPYSKTHSYAYDALGQLIETTDTLGGKTKALYDARGNLIALTDAKGNTTRFEYDRNNRLTRETLPLGQSTQYEYDDAGNLKSRLDPLGNKNTYSFDAGNRLIEMKQTRAGQGGGLTLVRTTTYTWNETDQLTAWTDTDTTRPGGQQTASAILTYDNAGRKTGETVSYPNPQGSNTSLSYGYGYSPAGKKTQLTWADGTQIGYSYAAHGELESVSIPGEGSITVNQFKWTAPTQITLPGGSTVTKLYDGVLQPESVQVKTPGQQNTLSLKHTWGKAFELQFAQLSQTAGGSTSSRDSTYTYDDELRLTQAKTDTGGLFGTDTETFALDGVANRTAHSKVSGTWTYDANNRLLTRGSATSYQYDDNGNLTQKSEGAKVTRYTYDTLNRLIEVWDASATSSAKLIARYGYDPMSRRIWKEVYRDKDANALAQAKRTTYLYADEGLIAEATQAITLNSTDNSVTASTTDAPQITTQYGPKPDAPFTTGVLFIKTKASNGQDLVAYYQHNHLQTPIQAIDKTGRVVWAAAYNAFGEATIITPAATQEIPTIVSNLRLPGQYFDEETGLHYNWHRYYDNQTGRYVTEDPLGVYGGVGLYGYVRHSPVYYRDEDGRLVWFGIPVVYWAIGALAVGSAVAIAPKPRPGSDFPSLSPWGGGSTANPMSGPALKKGLSPADEAQKDLDHKNYHNTCDNQEPPPGLTLCEEAKWQYRQAMSCKRKREEWEQRWGHPGSKEAHERALANVKNRLKKSAERIAMFCCGE